MMVTDNLLRMSRGIVVILILTVCVSSSFVERAEAKSKLKPVTVDGDEVTFNREKQMVEAKGNVVIKYEDVVLTCDKVSYNATTNVALAEGNVTIRRTKGGVVTADYVKYNFNDKTAQIENIHISSPPIYGAAQEGYKVSENEYIIEKGYVTTCDLKKPHYRLVSKRITVYPGVKVVAKNVVMKVGNTPVFYIPYFSQSLKDRSFPVEVIPGKNSDWGYHMLTRLRYNFNEKNRGKIYLDWYEKRGFGSGLAHKFDFGKGGEGTLDYYHINDNLYDENKVNKYPPGDRYKAEVSYHNQISPNLSVVGEFHKFSDPDFMKDFFERQYDVEPHPLSYLLADYSFPHASLSLLMQKRANQFFEETEYLPQLEYNFYNRKITESFPLYFKSKILMGYLTKKYASSSLDYDAMRFHTHNVFSVPTHLAWLSLRPYVGVYNTFYSHNIYGENNVWNRAFEGGISLSTKLYKTFSSPFNLFGENIEKMRHIITPRIEYAYIHSPTVSNTHLFDFDSVDTITRKDSITFTLENKVQVKGEGREWDLLYFSPAVEYMINEENKGSHFDNLSLDMEFYPRRGLSFQSDAKYDFLDRAFTEANVDFGIRDVETKRYFVLFGHRYSRKESSQGTLSFMYKLTPKVSFLNYLRYEFKSGDFKEQQYIIRRDLHCWWLDVGVDVDENHHFTVWFLFRLKAFPEVRVGFDHTYHGAREAY